MNVKLQTTSSGRTILFLRHNIREGKKVRTWQKKIGFLDELNQVMEDPITFYQEFARQQTEIIKKEKEKNTVVLQIDLNEKVNIDKDIQELRNVGYAFLKKIWRMLELNTFFLRLKKGNNLKIPLNKIVEGITYTRTLYPKSYLATFQDQNLFLEKFFTNKNELYRVLDILVDCKAELEDWLYERVKKILGISKYEIGLFDTTNFYFFSDPDGFRERDPSKEGRKLPIVNFGILTNRLGIPIASIVFAGNESERVKLIPLIEEMKKKHPVERIIIVGDKAFDTSRNVVKLLDQGNGFVFSRPVRVVNQKLRDWITDPEDYRETFTEDNQGNTVINTKIKSRIVTEVRTFREEDPETGEVKPVTKKITLKQVAFYSRKQALRSARKRNEFIQNTINMIENGSWDSAKGNGKGKYVDEYTLDENGQMVKLTSKKRKKADEKNIYPIIDWEKVHEESLLDGYYLYETSEIEMSDEEVQETYSGLWRIERGFRITKSQFDAMPIRVRTEDHIRSHLQICFLSLVIFQLLYVLLKEKISPEKLKRILKDFKYCHDFDQIYKVVSRDKEIKYLEEELSLPIRNVRYSYSNLLKVIKGQT